MTAIADWNKANNEGRTVNHLFREIPSGFIEELKRLNKVIARQQIDAINGIMDVYHNKLNLDGVWKKENYEKQYTNAVAWCQQYGIPFNA